jgi:hypothetical protein
MKTMRLIPILGLLLPSPAARGDGAVVAPADIVLRDCKEEPTRPGERKLSCPHYRASVSVEQPAFAADSILDTVMNGLPKDAKRGASRVEIPVGGARRPGLRYSLGSGKDPVRGVLAIVPSRAADKVRLVGCEETLTRACELVLEALARQAKSAEVPASAVDPAAPAAPASEPTVAGRRIATPAGCSYAPDGPKAMLRCDGANVSWSELQPDDPEGIDRLYQPFKKALGGRGRLTEKFRPCRLDGVEAECRVLDVALADGRTLESITVMAGVRGRRLFVQCNIGSARAGAPLPPPCSSLIRIE